MSNHARRSQSGVEISKKGGPNNLNLDSILRRTGTVHVIDESTSVNSMPKVKVVPKKKGRRSRPLSSPQLKNPWDVSDCGASRGESSDNVIATNEWECQELKTDVTEVPYSEPNAPIVPEKLVEVDPNQNQNQTAVVEQPTLFPPQQFIALKRCKGNTHLAVEFERDGQNLYPFSCPNSSKNQKPGKRYGGFLTKPSALQKSREKLKQVKEAEMSKKSQLDLAKKISQEKLAENTQRRKADFKQIYSKKTKYGQPLMGGRMEKLLHKIQSEKDLK